MTKETLIRSFEEKHKELKLALQRNDIEHIRKLTLDVHALVHPAEVSGRAEKTIADYVLDYMMDGHQNDLVPRENWEETYIMPGQTQYRCAGSFGIPIGLKI